MSRSNGQAVSTTKGIAGQLFKHRSRYAKEIIATLAVSWFICCQPVAAATVDMYVSHTNGVSKYFYDLNTDTVTLDGGFSLGLGGASGLQGPQGLAVGPDNLLYVVSQDSSPEKIVRFDRTTGAYVSTVANVPVPNDLVFGPDQSGDGVPDLYVTEFSNARAVRIPTQGPGAGGVNVFTTGGSLGGSTMALTFGPDGNLYISGRGANVIQRFDGTTGAFIDTFATQASASPVLFSPDGTRFYSGNALANSQPLSQFDGSTGGLLDGNFGGNVIDSAQQAAFGPDYNNNGSLDIYVGNGSLGSTNVRVIDGLTGEDLINIINDLGRPRDILFVGNIVPEPASGLLFAMGGLGTLVGIRRGRMRR